MDSSPEKAPPAAALAGCGSPSPPAAVKPHYLPSSTTTTVPTARVARRTAVDSASAPQSYAQKMTALDPSWAWKIGLRLLIIVGDTIAIGCSAPTISNYKLLDPTDTTYDDGPDLEPVFLFCLLIPVIVSVAWSSLYTMIKLCSTSSRPGHSGVAVAFDLLIWLALIVTLAYSALNVDNISTTVGGKLQLVFCIMQGIALVLHFVLFVQACVDTSKRNSAMKAPTSANRVGRLV